MIAPSNVNRFVFVIPTNCDQCAVDTEQLHKSRKASCFRQTFHIKLYMLYCVGAKWENKIPNNLVMTEG
jgi:hypothetical protein